jgi:transposase
MRPYSKDLRLRIVQAYEHREGSMRQLATRFRVSLSCVRDLLTRYRATGDVAPKSHGGGYPAKLDAPGRDTLQALVQATPDATLQELCTRLAATHQVSVSPSTISRALTTLGLPRKKKRFAPPSKSGQKCNGNEPRFKPPSSRSRLKTWCFSMKRAAIRR